MNGETMFWGGLILSGLIILGCVGVIMLETYRAVRADRAADKAEMAGSVPGAKAPDGNKTAS